MSNSMSHDQIRAFVENVDLTNTSEISVLKGLALKLIDLEGRYSYLIDAFLSLIEDQAFNENCSQKRRDQMESIARLTADMISGEQCVRSQLDLSQQEMRLRLTADNIRGFNGKRIRKNPR